MHDDEFYIDVPLVRALLDDQQPQIADLPLAPLPSHGTDHAIYRLGPDLCVRLPRHPGATERHQIEQQWLPFIAPKLPLPIPTVLHRGFPHRDYPAHWSVCRWVEGEDAATTPPEDLNGFAVDLARFVHAFWRISLRDGPRTRRGLPLQTQDTAVRAALNSLQPLLDVTALEPVWQTCLQAPAWNREPVWLHGDLLPSNLLLQGGRLSGIIDFGLMGVGDPACDLITAWSLLDAEARTLFREQLAIDDATWARGRGWALSIALIILPYYWETNPDLVRVAKQILTEIGGVFLSD